MQCLVCALPTISSLRLVHLLLLGKNGKLTVALPCPAAQTARKVKGEFHIAGEEHITPHRFSEMIRLIVSMSLDGDVLCWGPASW